MCRWSHPQNRGFAFSFHVPPPAPRPAGLPKDAVVKEFAKSPLSGLVHAPLNSPPDPEQAWAPPSTHVTLPTHRPMNRASFMARPPVLASRCTADTLCSRHKDSVSLATHPPRLCEGRAMCWWISCWNRAWLLGFE